MPGHECSQHHIAPSPRPLILSVLGSKVAHRLFMRSLDFGTRSRQFGLGHVARKSADIVLQKFILAFEFVMIGLDRLNTFCKSLERGLKSLCLPTL